uniref:Uncharacterized protein n=1 Tax=Sphaerodactylus townsendi TaxID=933632 RepID=A0ACB8FLL3_9SAUR
MDGATGGGRAPSSRSLWERTRGPGASRLRALPELRMAEGLQMEEMQEEMRPDLRLLQQQPAALQVGVGVEEPRPASHPRPQELEPELACHAASSSGGGLEEEDGAEGGHLSRGPREPPPPAPWWRKRPPELQDFDRCMRSLRRRFEDAESRAQLLRLEGEAWARLQNLRPGSRSVAEDTGEFLQGMSRIRPESFFTLVFEDGGLDPDLLPWAWATRTP